MYAACNLAAMAKDFTGGDGSRALAAFNSNQANFNCRFATLHRR